MKYTENSNSSFSVSWNIKNFNMCPLNYQKKIRSPPFLVGTNWRLILYPKGISHPDYMSIYLFREPCHSKFENIIVDLEFTLKSTHVVITKELHNVCFKEGNLRGVSKLLRIRYRNGKYNFSCKQLTITCRIRFSNDRFSHNTLDSLLLSNHLLLLFKSGYLADLVICCRKKSFLVHTAILKARCPKLFDYLDFVNYTSFPQRAKIIQFKITIFGNLLKYIYTGRLPVPLHNLHVKLYEVACLLEMKDLIETISGLPDIFSILTTFRTEQCSFTWTVAKWHLLEEKSLLRILHFNTMYFNDLIMRINTIPQNIQDNLSIHFSLNNFDVDRPVFLWYKIFLKDTQRNTLRCIHRKNSFGNDGTWLGNKTFDFEMIPDKFVLECQIEMSDETYTSQVEAVIDDTSPNSALDSRYYCNTVQLSKDMNSLFESGKFSDITIHSKDNLFAVHRAILEVRSSFFRKLFKQFKIINGHMTINCLSPYLLRWSILFAYSGTVQILKRKDLIALYRFAIALDMEALKQKCASCMYKKTKLIRLYSKLGD